MKLVAVTLCLALALTFVSEGARAELQYSGSPGAPPLDVPFVATPQEVVDQMLALAQPTSTDVVYDLGSGDGRLVVTAAERFGARGLGVDLDPARIEEARRNALRAGVSGLAKFKQGDLFKVDLRPATVLTLYLLTEVNLRLRPRILRELRPGARVASHAFSMGDWQPDQMVKVGHATVYFWIVPAPVAGIWSWQLPGPNGPRRYAVKIGQRFQMVQGAVRLPEDNPAALTEATLRGDELAFTLVEGTGERRTTTHYRGKVQGNAVTGFARTDGAAERPWRASLTHKPGDN